MDSWGGFTRKISGGVDEDLPLVVMNLGTAAVADSSEDGPAPHPEVEGSFSSSSCGRPGSRSASVVLEAEEPRARKELTLDNLSSSRGGRFPSPPSRSMSTEPVVGRLAPDQGRKEANPLNIGNGVAGRQWGFKV